jgi:hypothetical protein
MAFYLRIYHHLVIYFTTLWALLTTPSKEFPLVPPIRFEFVCIR